MLVAVHVSVVGIVSSAGVEIALGRKKISSAPDNHFAAGPDCRVTISAAGALGVLVAVQLSVPGWYLPPVFKTPPGACPPQTIISKPVHTAV